MSLNRYIMSPQFGRYVMSPQFAGFGADPSIDVYISGSDAERCVAAVQDSGEVAFVGKGAEVLAAKDAEIKTWKWVAVGGGIGALALGGLVGWYVAKRRG